MYRPPMALPRRPRGFTLIELMIAMVVIAVLASIALPYYGKYLVNGNRSAAQAHMLELAQAEQQYLSDSRSYATTVALLNMTTPARVASKYTITIEVVPGPPPRFTITATPIAGTDQAVDGPLTLDNAGTKTPSTKW